jgi:hypothetical protein
MGVLAVSWSVFHSRRAERFAQLLEEAEGARRHHSRDRAGEELTDLVALGRRISYVPMAVEADPEYRIGLRAMLMATIEREGIGATAIDPEPTIQVAAARHRRASTSELIERVRPDRRPAQSRVRSRRARAAVVVGIAAGALALSGMSAASGDAVPGDALYGLKRSTEQAQLALAGSDLARGQLHFAFAKTRLSEANSLHSNLSSLTTVLNDMDNQTREAVRLLTTVTANRHDTAPLDAVDAFVAVQRRGLTALSSQLSGPALSRVQDSVALLDTVRHRSAGLRTGLTACNGTGSGSDELGPQPRTCKNERGAGLPAQGVPPAGTGNGNPAADLPGGTGTTGTPNPTDVHGVEPTGTPKPSDDAGHSSESLLDRLRHALGDLLG